MIRVQLKNPILLVLIVLVLAALACNLPQGANTATAPSKPAPTATAPGNQARKPPEQLQTAAAGSNTSSDTPIELTISEAQLAALIDNELTAVQEPSISDVQVLLNDGQIQVSAKIVQDGLTLPLNITLNVLVDQQGQLQYQVIDAKVGPFPLPEETIAQFSSQLDLNKLIQATPEINNMIIEDIVITDGTMTITSRAR